VHRSTKVELIIDQDSESPRHLFYKGVAAQPATINSLPDANEGCVARVTASTQSASTAPGARLQ
jgi:hypothetical protein